MNLSWLGHASFRLDCGKVVYFDPFRVNGPTDADLILVSHGHYDHCDPASISSLSKGSTTVVCSRAAAGKVGANPKVMAAGEVAVFGELKVEAHPAYNISKPSHPEGMGLGYVVESQGKRVYFAGDTDLIPHMGSLGSIDVALLPVGGTYTMDWQDAAQAVKKIRPKMAVPMHYGEVVGSVDDALSFEKAARQFARVFVAERGKSFDV
jgi:L-ascorbate metabolism protein UlaG (beta-lactamase superfamily)